MTARFLQILSVLALLSLSQVNDGAKKLSIAMTSTTLSFDNKTSVHLKAQNLGKKFEKGHSWGWFILSKHKDGTAHCISRECFDAFAGGEIITKICEGKSYETDIELTDLYWHNMVSSALDFSRPKNMFTEIPTGEYYLRYEFHNVIEPSKVTSENTEIKSNEILVKVHSQNK